MNVFVYGTLTDREQVDRVLTEYDFVRDAVVQGLHRAEGTYPTLAPGGSIVGRLLETPEIERLDRYEGVERGLYVRVSVPVESDLDGPSDADDLDDRDDHDDFGESAKPTEPDGLETAALYVGDPVALDVETKIEWPGEGPLRRRVERYVREHGVQVQAQQR